MTAELIIEHTDVMSKIHIDKRYRENLLNQLINQKNIDMQSIILFANHLQYDLSTNKVVAIFKIKNADKLSTEVFQNMTLNMREFLFVMPMRCERQSCNLHAKINFTSKKEK